MDEDPKVLLSTGLALMPGKCYQHLAWGPDGIIAGKHDCSRTTFLLLRHLL